MYDIKSHLKELMSYPGLSGYEESIRNVIAESWKPFVDELSTSRLGSLHGFLEGNGSPPRCSILLAAHMDAVGLMVTGIINGFLRVSDFRSVDYRILPGQEVIIHGKKDIPGVIVQPPDFLLPPSAKNRTVKTEHLFVDIGMPENEIKKMVQPGNPISFSQPALELTGDIISGHSIDNRVSVAAITFCLHQLKKLIHECDVWAVATVQEEETLAGAFTSPFQIQPSMAVAIDVTHAKAPGVPDYIGLSMGKGPALGWGANVHPEIYRRFKRVAEEMEIPYQTEIMPSRSGTDAHAMQIVAYGLPTFVMSIPVRYMHTPVETVSLIDAKRSGRLLAFFISQISNEFMNTLSRSVQ